MKYFVYSRKSTEEEDRQALSIESQKAEILRKFSDLEIVGILQESFSASKPGRPIFNEMMTRLASGEADGIIAWHPDRLSRNPVDAGAIIYAVDTGVIKDLKFCSYTFENSPEGKMFLSMTLSQSKYTTDKLSVDIKRGNARKAVIGQPPGWALTGYRNVHLDGGKVTWEIDERFKEGYRMILEEAKNPDASIKSLVEMSQRLGLKTRSGSDFCLSVMDRWLRNKVLCGWFLMLGEYYKTDFEPLISEDWWNEIQYARGYRSRPRTYKEFGFLLPGFIKCGECGSSIVTFEKRKYYKSTDNHAVYKYCTCGKRKKNVPCHQPAMKESELIALVQENIEKIQIDGEVWELCKKLLRKKHKQEMNNQVATMARLQSQYKGIKNQLGNLLDLRIRGVVDTDEEYLAKKEGLQAEERRLAELLKDSDSNINKWLELAENYFKTAYQAQEIFKNGTLKQKRELIRVTGLNLYLQDKKLSFEHKMPYDILANRPDNCNWWNWGFLKRTL